MSETDIDPDEAARVRAKRVERVAKWVLPVAVLALGVWFWDRIVVWNDIPHYLNRGRGWWWKRWSRTGPCCFRRCW